jgi:hypothetical protein
MIPRADQNTMVTPGDLEHREIPNPEKTEFERNEIDPAKASDSDNEPDDEDDLVT